MKKFFLLGLLVTSTACSDTGAAVRDTLGLNKSSPDEFRVVARPPLSVPDEFYLYPPDEASLHAAKSQEQDAKSLLFGGEQDNNYLDHYQTEAPRGGVDTAVAPVSAGALPSPSEDALLDKLGARKADPNIRDVLAEEYEAAHQEQTVLERLKTPMKKGETVVDPMKERERLMEAKRKGRPVNEGEVPEIKESESLVDWLF